MTEYFFIFEVIEEMKSEDYSEIRTNFHFEQEVIDNVTRDFSSPYVSARVIKDGSGCIIQLYPFRFTPSLSEKDNRDYGVKLTCLGHLDDTNDCAAIIEDVWMPIIYLNRLLIIVFQSWASSMLLNIPLCGGKATLSLRV